MSAAARPRIDVTAEVDVENKARKEGLRIASLCRWLMVSQGEGLWCNAHEPGVCSKGSFEGRMSKMRSGIGPSKAATPIHPRQERPLRMAKACAPYTARKVTPSATRGRMSSI